MRQIRLNYSKTWFAEIQHYQIGRKRKGGKKKIFAGGRGERTLSRNDLLFLLPPSHFRSLRAGPRRGGRKRASFSSCNGGEENWKNLADKAEHFSLLPLLFFPSPLPPTTLYFHICLRKAGGPKIASNSNLIDSFLAPAAKDDDGKKRGRRGNVQ